MNGLDSYSALIEALSPGQRKSILGLGTIDERSELVRQQLAQAQAARQPMAQHSTPLGAALGGLGNILGNARATMGENAANAQLAALTGERQAGRDAYSQALIDLLRKRRQQVGMDITSPGGGVIAPGPTGGGW